MEKKNTGLVILIIILSVLVVALSGYIVYDKMLNNNDLDNNINADIDNSNEDDISVLSNDEALDVAKKLIKKYYAYKHALGPYCGETNSKDYISFGSYETRDFRDYWASTEFKSISEIRNYFKSIMTSELMPHYLDNAISYLEQDGKLYCQLSHKGPGESYNEEASYYTIHSVDSNTIKVNAIVASNQVDYILRREGMIEIVKDDYGNWVVSKYDVQISDLD